MYIYMIQNTMKSLFINIGQFTVPHFDMSHVSNTLLNALKLPAIFPSIWTAVLSRSQGCLSQLEIMDFCDICDVHLVNNSQFP